MSIEIDTKQLDNEYFRPSSPDLSSKNAIEHEEPCSLQYHFDNFFMCYTLKNQFINYYRYGQRPDCSSKWKDFVWCIRTKNKAFDEQQNMLRDKRLQKHAALKLGRNSEEVWSLRTSPLNSLFDRTDTSSCSPTS
ncbi:unnamed protein product [Pneumocystis jirovecii]|uniref:Uncharacterized protein n=2 Tax=Pneumocystis jirovecii TaxID=42068 RepID=L0PEK1_PNEJI|nr:uncharacterized protein T551_01825 [Pneumocystis jirovecii RU7]KTW30542.1 hypothetical protein T551_01825 [Pneumocystis jirovecii RU7]CCJ30494.1 unnamed protein product [Pneumocystis jirovecii]